MQTEKKPICNLFVKKTGISVYSSQHKVDIRMFCFYGCYEIDNLLFQYSLTHFKPVEERG